MSLLEKLFCQDTQHMDLEGAMNNVDPDNLAALLLEEVQCLKDSDQALLTYVTREWNYLSDIRPADTVSSVVLKKK